ncbi:MAG: hypothetical protein ACOCVX_01645 [Bacteroidales bacterium]
MVFPIIISFVFAIVFAVLLPSLFRRDGPGPWQGILFYFLIIFLFTWAVGSWISPFGPVAYGISWMGYLFIAFFIMILIGVLVPPSPTASPTENDKAMPDKNRRYAGNQTGINFGIFFWALIIILLGAGITHMLIS